MWLKMVSEERIQEIMSAYRHYCNCGIIVHPLEIPIDGDRRTGKTPQLRGWNVQKLPFDGSIMLRYAKTGCNLGIVCGRASDVSVVDVDWYRKGIMDFLTAGLDTSRWCLQKHGTGEKGHIIFRYAPTLEHSLNYELGFDVLAQNLTGKSSNCVCAPSIHADGTKYRMNIDIAERPAMPEILIQRIRHLRELQEGLKEVLGHCRVPFQMLWKNLFSENDSEIFHQAGIFRKNEEGRQRSLGMFTELKANGATLEMLLLGCMLVFGDDYDEKRSMKELSYLDASKTFTNARIAQDVILGKFFQGTTFDPFTCPMEKMEAMLKPEAMEAYERIMVEAPIECLDTVRRAFLVGVFSKNGYIKSTDQEDGKEEVKSVEEKPETKIIYKHGEPVEVPVDYHAQASTEEDIELLIKELKEEPEDSVVIDPRDPTSPYYRKSIQECFEAAFKGREGRVTE